MSILSFNESPPEFTYGDPSFFIGVLFETEDYYDECIQFSRKLEIAESLVALSPLGLDEIWFAALKLLASNPRLWRAFLAARTKK